MAELTIRELELAQEKINLDDKLEQVLSKVRLLGVVISDIDYIRNYLLCYPDIIDLILPICRHVKKEFPSPAQVLLEVYRDPEIDDKYISIEICQKEYDENVMKQIEQIEAEHQEELIGKSGWIIVTTNFRQLR